MKRRTALITAASVAGVILAGSAAVGANIGILNTAEGSPVGELSAAVPVAATAEPVVVDVYLDEAAQTPSVDQVRFDATEFAVEDAGTVSVDRIDGAIRLGDVRVNAGWTWTSTQASDTDLLVTFVSGDAVYEFAAALGNGDTIEARVDQPIIQTIPATSAAGGYDDEYKDDDHDEDHDEDDEYEEDDHDEDHDEDEHEGADDDD